MSMLTHGFEQPVLWKERPARMSTARKVRLKRLAVSALTLLSMGSVLTVLIALRTAIYVWHLHA
ncbi:hypothetical protein RAD15_16695 [Bradyrhizobium sp. 14AA]